MSSNYDIVTPDAGVMIESLRAFGYDLATALADLIDNSIAAGARNIWINFSWAGKSSRILIRDDGRGMKEKELVAAMRLGTFSPLMKRGKDDLGRFGLGLKTASFSQCRRLVVFSKAKKQKTCVRCWDLNYVVDSADGEWRLLKVDSLLSSYDSKLLSKQKTGTVVVLEELDRVVGNAATNDQKEQKRFREKIDDVKAHLSMVFHRFLTGRKSLKIFLNGGKIEPWDPFIEGSSDPLSEDPLICAGEQIRIAPFVLPHHSRISKEVHKAAAGPRGWNAQQGFYVYRNKRLIVSGDWLGLGVQKEEHYKLARIRVDLPNSLDEAWGLDVRKAQAHPPARIREDMKRIARATREKAAKIYRHRGKILQRKHADDLAFVWLTRVKGGKTFYKINRKHPLVKRVKTNCEQGGILNSMLAIIEQSVPAPLISIKNSEEPDSLGLPFEDDLKALQKSIQDVYETLVTEEGLTKKQAAERIVNMEPFNYHPDVLAVFLDGLNKK